MHLVFKTVYTVINSLIVSLILVLCTKLKHSFKIAYVLFLLSFNNFLQNMLKQYNLIISFKQMSIIHRQGVVSGLCSRLLLQFVFCNLSETFLQQNYIFTTLSSSKADFVDRNFTMLQSKLFSEGNYIKEIRVLNWCISHVIWKKKSICSDADCEEWEIVFNIIRWLRSEFSFFMYILTSIHRGLFYVER